MLYENKFVYSLSFFFFGFWFHCLLMEDYSFLFLKLVSFCLEIVLNFRCLLFYRQTNIPIDLYLLIDFGINRRFSIDLWFKRRLNPTSII